MARPQVALVTSREDFETYWRAALAGAGLDTLASAPEGAAELVRGAAALVLDSGSGELSDEDELLAWAGSAAARGRPCAVVAATEPERRRLSATVLFDVAGGLIVGPEDTAMVASTIVRRADPSTAQRFDYVTVAPDGDELLAISAAGHARLVPRPATTGDSGAAIVEIRFDEDARAAHVELDDGAGFTVDVEVLGGAAPAAALETGGGDGAGRALPIDGVTLGRRMRELRVAAGLTQAELARRTGIHRPNIARVEAGRHTPSLETVARIAHAIGVSPTRVLSGH